MIHIGIPSFVFLSNLTVIALRTMKSAWDLRLSKYWTLRLWSCRCYTTYCGKKIPMFQRNLLLPTSGRSIYIAGDHQLAGQWCHILKFQTSQSSSTNCRTEQSRWDLSLYNVVQPEPYSTMNMETTFYSETQAPIYLTVI